MVNYLLWLAIAALVALIVVLIVAIYTLYRKLTLAYFIRKGSDSPLEEEKSIKQRTFEERLNKIQDKIKDIE